MHYVFFLQESLEEKLKSIDTEAFIGFLEIEHEFNHKIKHSDNVRYIRYVKDISLLRGPDSKQMRINIRSAIKRYTHHIMGC